MDSNGLTDLRELHRDHVVFQELFWTESFEWRDEMTARTIFVEFLEYVITWLIISTEKCPTVAISTQNNSWKENSLIHWKTTISFLKFEKPKGRENRNTIIICNRPRKQRPSCWYYHDEMLPYLPTISQTKITFWVDRLLAV